MTKSSTAVVGAMPFQIDSSANHHLLQKERSVHKLCEMKFSMSKDWRYRPLVSVNMLWKNKCYQTSLNSINIKATRKVKLCILWKIPDIQNCVQSDNTITFFVGTDGSLWIYFCWQEGSIRTHLELCVCVFVMHCNWHSLCLSVTT